MTDSIEFSRESHYPSSAEIAGFIVPHKHHGYPSASYSDSIMFCNRIVLQKLQAVAFRKVPSSPSPFEIGLG